MALIDAWQALGIEILTAVRLATTETPLPEAAQEHVPIAEALFDGDSKRASALLRNHVGEYGIHALMEAGISWNYTSLNIASLIDAAVLVVQFIRTGGIPMCT